MLAMHHHLQLILESVHHPLGRICRDFTTNFNKKFLKKMRKAEQRDGFFFFLYFYFLCFSFSFSSFPYFLFLSLINVPLIDIPALLEEAKAQLTSFVTFFSGGFLVRYLNLDDASLPSSLCSGVLRDTVLFSVYESIFPM